MKLRNKKTGEILDSKRQVMSLIAVRSDATEIDDYSSIAELNEEWEDYKPKTNSRFRLVKDLPTFKAGEEFHLSPKGNLVLNDGDFGICAYAKQTLEKFPHILTDWFEPIDDEDTNALSKEPLIKDEKIRKAVRAWAELANVSKDDKILYHIVATKKEFEYYGNALRFGSFDAVIPKISDNTYYTITELCGEEE